MRNFNKIFGVGLSRTGTTSLSAALRALGFPTIHWPTDMLSIVKHRAAVDITVACRFRELDQLFPSSLFIYTQRERQSWSESVKRHYAALGSDLKLPDGKKQFAQEADIRIYGSKSPLGCDFAGAYDRHDASVLRYFEKRTDDLLCIDIVGGEGWEKLCPFLGLPVLELPFPHKNMAEVSQFG